MRKRILFGLPFLLVLLLAAGCLKDTGNNEVIPIMVTEVSSPASDDNNCIYSGNVEPYNTVPVAFTVGGYIREIMHVTGSDGQIRLVQQGDRVKKNAILAHVRDVDYSALVNQASAQVAGKAALTEQAQYGLQQTQATYDRASAGVAEAVAARDQARTGYEQAKSGLAAAQSQLAEARAATQAAKAQVEQAEAGKEKAESDFKRADRLYSSKSLTRADYDAAKAQLKVAQAQLKAAKEQVNVANTKIEQAKVQIDANRSKMDQTKAMIAQSEAVISSAKAQKRAAKAAVNGAKAQVEASAAGIRAAKAQLTQAETPLGDANLKAPMDGVILKRNIELGTLVGPGTPGFILANDSSVKVVFGIPDVLMKKLHIGDMVLVTTQAYADRNFDGKITSISPAADPKSRVFQVEVTVNNRDKALKIGMVAKVVLDEYYPRNGSITVPLSAVVRSPKDNKSYAVYIVKREHGKLTACSRKVNLGDTLGNTIVVNSGLSYGDRIITNGATLVHDGARVVIVK